MKIILIGLTLLASMTSMASTPLHGDYSGKTEKGKICTISIYPKKNDIVLVVGLSEKLLGSKSYQFSLDEGIFFERVQAGGNSVANIHEDNPWTDYLKNISLSVSIYNGSLESYEITGERSGPFTINANGSVNCSNLVKQ